MARVEEALAALAGMPPAQLRDQWQRVYKAPAPRLPSDLLRMGIAYRMQEKVCGRLPVAASRALQRIASGKTEASKIPLGTAIRPGTRLVRSWQGRTISVLAVEEGFLFEDQVYPSLTSIACAVTGSNRSGPRFFGLVGNG